jgi:phospholipid/cholesterol/gamma-HCH transport system permease protein
MSAVADAPAAMLRIGPDPAGGSRLVFAGPLDARAVARHWPAATRGAAEGPRPLVMDLSAVTALDTAGAVMLLRLQRLGGDALRVEGLAQDGAVAAVLDRTRRALAAPAAAPPASVPWLGQIGHAALESAQGLLGRLAFLGEAVLAGAATVRRPWRLRAGEVMRHLDEAGLRAFPLTVLLGVLIGLILAFQSSIPMRQFGAEIFIPSLVGISLVRELGPLMAAVVLSGRTGSAYAAELGTMTVNEEVDALRIMGIDPIAWLVLPRVLAAMLVMPVLSLVMNLAGLAGMTVVMATLGFPLVAVTNQLQQWVDLGDLAGGLFKAACFGLAIGLVGCRAGLAAGRGPRAVGDAATAAVVGGIVSVVVLDGVFAVLFFRLDW